MTTRGHVNNGTLLPHTPFRSNDHVCRVSAYLSVREFLEHVAESGYGFRQ